MKQTSLLCTLVLFTVVSGEHFAGEGFPSRPAECSEYFEQGSCTTIMDPVCATDGQTYDDECELCHHNKITEENVEILYEGECPWDSIYDRRKRNIPFWEQYFQKHQGQHQ